MKIVVRSPVPYDYKWVYEAMNRDMLEYLMPSNVELLRYDGPEVGGIVKVRFKFPVKRYWTVKITEVKHEPGCSYFVDEGVEVPFSIVAWKHQHIVEQDGQHAVIIDDVYFKATNPLWAGVLYLGFFFSFKARKRGYRKYLLKKMEHEQGNTTV